MRYLLVLIMAAALAVPAHAAEKAAPTGESQNFVSPAPLKAKPQREKTQGMTNLHEVGTVVKGLKAPDKSPVMIVGRL